MRDLSLHQYVTYYVKINRIRKQDVELCNRNKNLTYWLTSPTTVKLGLHYCRDAVIIKKKKNVSDLFPPTFSSFWLDICANLPASHHTIVINRTSRCLIYASLIRQSLFICSTWLSQHKKIDYILRYTIIFTVTLKPRLLY